jgi:copper chaperone
MSQATLKVAGMTCESCADSVEGAVRGIGAVAHADVPGQTVTVEYDENKVSLNKIKDAIEGQGYNVK